MDRLNFFMHHLSIESCRGCELLPKAGTFIDGIVVATLQKKNPVVLGETSIILSILEESKCSFPGTITEFLNNEIGYCQLRSRKLLVCFDLRKSLKLNAFWDSAS
ncbi:Hypothetical protein NTJ_09166 [Nesidiocoris tenuis]|uniref:Uncharacterized protein n=1 Tax=Nesidiocoris tenuis TaxID=355587 RepID=A0ABN7AVY7_9HEMI|nr:Hypothetical protein NTJ_09166 [Nesidiocoris tenuis]